MLRAFVITAATAAALCATSASAQQIINLGSVNTSTGGAPTATTLTLGPGSYVATLIGIANGGMYDAWNAASSNNQFYPSGTPSPAAGFYSEEYTVTVGSGATVDVYGGPNSKYATASAALAANAGSPYQFNVTSPNTVVSFVIRDTLYSDNTGGVSLRINAAAVPEPATWAMMIVGFGVAGYAMRRRSRTVTTVSYAA